MACRENVADGLYPVGKLRDRYISSDNKSRYGREYPEEWKQGKEAYYPINDERNDALYKKYRELAGEDPDVIFGGRLGEYRYYDMDKVIEKALSVAQEELKKTI